jgi:diguanylate cyclase (GGDEF)-like protein/PAS domain S-box-containing protein
LRTEFGTPPDGAESLTAPAPPSDAQRVLAAVALPKRTLSRYLLLRLWLCAALPTLLLGGLAAWNQANRRIEEARAQVAREVGAVAWSVQTLLTQARRQVEADGKALALTARFGEASFQPILAQMLEARLVDFPFFYSLFVLAPDGSRIAGAPAVDRQGEAVPWRQYNFSDREYYREVLRRERPYISKPFRARGGGRVKPLVAVSAPIRREGQLIAILVGTLITHEGLRDNPLLTPRAGTETIVLDGEGKVVFAIGTSRYKELEPPRGLSLPPAGEGADAFRTLDSETGERYETATAPIAAAGWTVVMRRPLAALLPPVTRTLQLTGAIFAAILLLYFPIARYLATTATRPISELTQRLRVYSGAEEPPQVVGSAAFVELAELRRAYNRMAEAIQHSRTALQVERDGLAHEVAARTLALRRRSAILETVAKAGEMLWRAADWQDAAPEILSLLGTAASAHRAYLRQLTHSGDRGLAGSRFEWVAPGTESLGATLAPLRPADPPYQTLEAGGVVASPIAALPAGEWRHCLAADARSIAWAPVYVSGQFWGLLGLDDCLVERDWSEGEILALRAGANTLGAAIGEKQRDGELAAKAAALHDFLESSHDLVQSVDGEGNIEFVNRAWREALGYRDDEVRRLHLRDVIAPSCLDHCLNLFGRLLNGEDVGEIEAVLHARCGREIIVRGFSSCRFEGGRAVSTRSFFRDVTAEIQVQNALQRSEAQARQIVQESLALVCTHDLDGFLLSINPAVEATLGYSAGEMVGRSLREFLPPAVRPLFGEYLQRQRQGSDRGTMLILAKSGEEHVFQYANRRVDVPGSPSYILGSAIDVTARRAAETALRESEANYRQLIDESMGFVITHDLRGVVLSANPAAAEALGYSQDEILGRNFLELVPERHRAATQRGVARWRDPETRVMHGELELQHRDGSDRVWRFHNRRIEPRGKPPFVLSHAVDVTDQRRVQEFLRKQALTDPVTGLANRSLFQDRLAHGLAQAQRRRWNRGEENRLAVAIMDLDGLEEVNDAFGHAAGDALLREVASRLRSSVRNVDTVARLGGAEFAVVLPEIGSPQNARRLLDKTRAWVSQPYRHDGHDLPIAVSLGVSLSPENGDAAAALVDLADRAMYVAKRAGGNQVVVAEEGPRAVPA